MGGIAFGPEVLGDSLSETAGYKSGLALSIEEMCDHLSNTRYADVIRESELRSVRVRSEEYEDIFFKLLHRIGYTKEEHKGIFFGARLFRKYRGTKLEKVHEGVTKLFNEIWPLLIQESIKNGKKAIDPTPLIIAAGKKFRRNGVKLAIEQLELFDEALKLSPHSRVRYREWEDSVELGALFQGGSGDVEAGTFIDQRFINYLIANNHRIDDMHWRKFEELTAEYFCRQGYEVKIGPGVNDDGIDVRIWKKGEHDVLAAPHMIVQCKRQKAKIEKVIVKGLYADVQFSGADFGLIVTTSELSPGARETIRFRGYPIHEVDNAGIKKWLCELERPGTGIVRI